MLLATLRENEIRAAIGLPGTGARVVDGVAPLSAVKDRCLYFINRRISESEQQLLAERKGCIVIASSDSLPGADLGDCLVLRITDARLGIARVLEFIRTERRQRPWVTNREIAPDAVISPLASIEGAVEIGAGVTIEPFCMVGPEVRIERGSIIRSGVRIHSRVTIGSESIIGANAVIGSEGYGFVRNASGRKTRIPHLGGVQIGSQVEIGALSVVQSGTISPTIIEDNVKIDDNVEIAHNVLVGFNASIVGGVVVGGSAVIDTDSWIGINASVRDGCHLGAHSLVGMDASVQKDLPERTVARARRADVEKRSDDGCAIGFKRK